MSDSKNTIHRVQVRRIYEEPESSDGSRVLVDRLWPRGVSKERAHLTEWLGDVAPSTDLRRWYAHDPEKFEEFTNRYREELQDPDRAEAMDRLGGYAEQGTLTLLTATKRADISEAAVLKQLLDDAKS